ncbi:MAG: AAA family ATPase [Candidatus Eiseniibacteriota bacterium]|jgi:ATP-dependent Clp protease ATP-binding subunit ClpC
MIQAFLRRSTQKVQEAIYLGSTEMVEGGRTHFTPEFLLWGLLEQEGSLLHEVLDAASSIDDPVGRLRAELSERIRRLPGAGDGATGSGTPAAGTQEATITFGKETKAVLEQAVQEARGLSDRYVSTAALLLALFIDEAGPVAELLHDAGLTHDRVRESVLDMRGDDKIDQPDSESQLDVLKEFTTDLTEMARRGELDPVVGREREIERLIEILNRRKKNNPVLIGEAGVGKSVIVEGLAQAIANAEVPETMVSKRILSLEMADLVAGAGARGQFEQRLKAVRDAVVRAGGRVILFIDELHTVVGAGAGGGGVDASNMLKPALARGLLQTIGATTVDEYRKQIESDRALARRFQPVLVQEPTIEETIDILEGLQSHYEQHHGVRYSRAAIEAAARLSDRYVTDRALPDKAVDLVDEAGSRKHLSLHLMPPELQQLENQRRALQARKEDAFARQAFEEAAGYHTELLALEGTLAEARQQWHDDQEEESPQVEPEDIAEIIASWTGIPATRLVEEEASKLARMEEEIHRRIVGQEDAVTAVSNAIRRNRAGLRAADRPIGAFLFLGPTGVGKTELAKALAEFLFDDENHIVRLDMSEYMERHEVAKIIGAPPGYVGYGEGGQLTEKVRRQPYSVVLLDEVEKAHPDVFNLLLQVLDEGLLTDAMGRRVSFRNTIVIGTSNLGSTELADRTTIGFGAGHGQVSYAEAKGVVMTAVRKHFKPEFLNRIDDLIVFHSLAQEHIREILDIQLEHLAARMRDVGITVQVALPVREKLARDGFHPTYGARPLKREIEIQIENPLAMRMVSGELRTGDRVDVELDGEAITFSRTAATGDGEDGDGSDGRDGAPTSDRSTAGAATGDGTSRETGDPGGETAG